MGCLGLVNWLGAFAATIFLLGLAAQESVLIYRGVPVPGRVVDKHIEQIPTAEGWVYLSYPVVEFEGRKEKLDSHGSFKVGHYCVVLCDKQSGRAAHLGPRDGVFARLWACKQSVVCALVIGGIFCGGVVNQIRQWLRVMRPNLKLLSEKPGSFSTLGDCAKAIEQICISLLISLLWLSICWYGLLQVIQFKSTYVISTGMVMFAILVMSWVSLPAAWHWLRTVGVNLPRLKPWLQIGEMLVALYVCFQVANLFYGKDGNPLTSSAALQDVISDLLKRILGA